MALVRTDGRDRVHQRVRMGSKRARYPPPQANVELFGWPGRRVALQEFLQALANHVPSALLPIAAVVALLRWRPDGSQVEKRRALLMVAAVACAARARRGGEHIDFQSVVIELPLYVGVARSLFPRAMHSANAYGRAAATLGVLAVFSHWNLGHGLLTQRGWRPATETARGTLHLPGNHARLLSLLTAQVDSIDPTHTRPVFVFGYSGAINYLLKRENPTPLTQGFAYTVHGTAAENIALISHARPPVILIDNTIFEKRKFPKGGFNLIHWRAPEVPSPYERVDRPLFDGLARGCTNTGSPGGFRQFVVYDCPTDSVVGRAPQ